MIDSEIISQRCNHSWLCNTSLDGDTVQLPNGGRPSDVAHSLYQRSYSYAKIFLSARSLRDLNEVTPPGGRRSRKQ